MTRFLVTWLGFTILQLGIPRGTTAAELRRGDESARALPRFEIVCNGVSSRDEARSNDPRTTHAPFFAPTASAPPSLAAPRVEWPAQEGERSGSAYRPHLLPDARAPPA